MKKFLFRLSLFLLIQGVVGTLVISNAIHKPRFGYLAAFEDKEKLLQEHNCPHIIVVGGSNAAFGIDSQTLQQQLNMPVINAGLHGALGLRFYLKLAQRYAKPGDVIVLMPEWELLSSRLDPDSIHFRNLLREAPGAWKFVRDDSTVKEFVDTYALSEIASRVQHGLKWKSRRRQQRSLEQAKLPGKYSRFNFNRFGDFTGHHDITDCKVRRLNDAVFRFDHEHYITSVEHINALAERCEEKGVALYVAYSPIPEPVYLRSEEDLQAAHSFLQQRLKVPVLHPPDSVRFPVSHFHDSINHLNYAGKLQRSRIVANHLVNQSTARAGLPNRNLR